MAGCNNIQVIAPTECIGDSLTKINNNFANLDTDLCATATITSQVTSTTLFIPVNYSTRTNQNIVAIPGTGNNLKWTGSYKTNGQNFFWIREGTTSTVPWWSGVQTANLSGAPVNSVGALLSIFFNVNSQNNNGQHLLVRKDSTEVWNSPQDQGGAALGNITAIQRDNINYSYSKIYLDPTGGPKVPWEAEHDVTVPVYFNTASKTFQWFIIDGKNGGAPRFAPEYIVRITVLGYYVAVV